jgi:Tol biopolymer transport system component
MTGRRTEGLGLRDSGLTDDTAIELAFSRRARRGTPGDLRSSILEAVATTSQDRGVGTAAGQWLRRLRQDRQRRTLVLGFTLLALVALLVIAALAGQELRDRKPGERLAFIRDGDVYITDGGGASVVRVLHEDGVMFADPAWSPDGARLALESSAGTVILDPATGATQHTFSVDSVGPLVWSPNGKWIAFSSENPKALLRIDTTTGDVGVLDDSTAHLEAPRDPAWSPDSSRIAFIRYGAGCEGGKGCRTYVVLEDAGGSNDVELATATYAADRPSWSPDGTWMAFRTRAQGGVDPAFGNGLVIARPDGTGRRSITAANVGSYAWNAAGDGLWLTVGSAPDQPEQLWFAPISGLARLVVADIDPAVLGRSRETFAVEADTGTALWAPPTEAGSAAPRLEVLPPSPESPIDVSGTWPMLASSWSAGCEPGVADTRTGAVQLLSAICDAGATALNGGWSPDGSTYAAVLDSGTLTVERSDGTVAATVGGLEGLTGAWWSPDGRWLVASGAGRYVVLRPNGSLVRTIRAVTSGFPPTWSPGGTHLVIPTADAEFPAADGPLMVGGPDGADMHSIGVFPAPRAWAPDGSTFAFIRNGDVWTASVDGTGARSVTTFPVGGAEGVAWSPDGQWIAVIPERGLWLMHPDGTGRRFFDLGPAVRGFGVRWAPDSRRIAMSSGGADGEPQVILVDPTASQAVLIASASGPVWSPDGRFLGVMSFSSDRAFEGFAVMNADGAGRRLLPLNPQPDELTDFEWIP